MPHKLRKIRKTRGSRTQGYGRIGQHRDAGSKGNRKVGRHKHLWSKVVAYEPDYFGNHGFTSPQSINKIVNTLNIQRLTEIAETDTIDLTEMGYTKLLGTGKITKALTVTIPTCSKLAEEKITKAGGKVITTSQATGA
ncbi:MAG: 50S ribosomal protein L15 [Candidatus Bathyarchaeota archaeon]|jgi:large subunit ribosomal protein L15|nr:50S ribosomal protein L15 [Candidatus Termiticorpusculum sp.]